ncbi:hypothetical protein EJ070_03500 [Mesorhizobium sp. M1E.F.Ca.ET.045.02.1.1]|uniref:plasmid partitioning protein RepB C-terminal domain-containing protein n=1 Tax=Mesorhizobium sp. M1E.F.Ca.ET.045.02.1.1 TaxID=2493672 RepID=UPI000F75219F|nr:plasmid partitioning protein RepB C-terminal domain-containing protein [Mesorhizobium sp. M1E.F.Ca.ET.045.02.1.1]AZO19820.1 hypothetical protein EJ070_03500 [Mesorhizobium sp. M1E.F.Ca.ET.045.02.1.1]
MTQAENCPILKDSRHSVHLTGDLREPAGPLHKYVFLRTYKNQSERMRCFIREANASRERLDSVVEALRELLAIDAFRALLKAEGFAMMPRTLADRILGEQPATRIAEARPDHAVTARHQIVGGICQEVLDLLQDCVVPPKMFGLLRQVVPGRQSEIARLMLALERVKLNTARVFIALTPQSQLVDTSTPRNQFAGIAAAQLSAMETELAGLSQEFLLSAGRHGLWNLEHVAAQGFLNRLMDSPRVVRYLAQKFPAHLAEFQNVLEAAPRN